MMLDFYSGFEGEPAIVVFARIMGMPCGELRAWSGYFDTLMARIPPEDGEWTGIALPYHLQGGWYLGEPWQVPSIAVFIQQWLTVGTSDLSAECQEVHRAILQLASKALAAGGELWISEE